MNDDGMASDIDMNDEYENAADSIATDSEEQETDPVVQEIPVFLALSTTGLVLIQHPTAKRAHPLAEATTMRLKPLGQRFEVDIAINSNSQNYSVDSAEKLGRGIDNEDIATAYDKVKEDHTTKLLDKYTLQSSVLPSSTGGQYLIGALRDDEFHLTPIAATIQLRPALKYLDKILEKEQAAKAKIQEHEFNLENPNKKKEEAEERGVTVAARSIENDPEALRKAKELDEERKFAQEEWINLRLYNENSVESEEVYEKLFSLGDELSFTYSKNDYLQSIGPKLSSTIKQDFDGNKKNMKLNRCMDDISDLPLGDFLRSFMLSVHVIPFSTIKELTEPRFDELDLVEELERIAVHVRDGIWVVRSELLYAGRVCEARRILLQLLARSADPISRYEVNRIAKLPHTMITNMFIEICARVSGVQTYSGRNHVGSSLYALGPGGLRPASPERKIDVYDGDSEMKWGLKAEADNVFCERWPDFVEKHLKIVEDEGERARHVLNSRISSKISNPLLHQKGTATSTPIPRPGSSMHLSSKNGSSSSPLPVPTTIGSKATSSIKVKTEPTQASRQELFTVKGNSINEQCEYLIHLLLAKYGVASKEFLVASVLRHKSVPGSTGKENLLNNDSVNEEFIGMSIDGICVHVQTGRFVLKTLGSADQYRDVIINLFKTKTTLKKPEIIQACVDHGTQAIPQSTYLKIMRELATSSGPSWLIDDFVPSIVIFRSSNKVQCELRMKE
ncbi:DNA-directed RNA polymerase III subunit RPC5 [Physocladia obscura]|uniref:DNA-directed RNA polymerase III subunit RPC5 n=1 Tax=Physocladia obscura TaxID=109957 RepID=A0AAD5XHU1_9FUNG|nr:DNA-directed RNA polymerase III subunit RPC5 [Physocladia obscura]